MSTHSNRIRAGIGRPDAAIGGVVPNSIEHKILLALRGAPLLQEQLSARFANPSGPLAALQKKGLVSKPPKSAKGQEISLTDAGRTLLATHSGLSRRATEIVYCQL